MARVYSDRLLEWTLSEGSATELDIEEGDVVVVKHIDVFIVNAAPYDSGALITIAGNGLTFAWWSVPAAFNGHASWTGRRVLPGPSTLTAAVEGPNAVVELQASGFLFLAP